MCRLTQTICCPGEEADMEQEIETKVERIVKLIRADYSGGKDIDKINIFNKPDKAAVIDIVQKLLQIVFPGYFWDRSFKFYSAKRSLAVLTEDVFYRLNQQIAVALRFDDNYEGIDDEEIRDTAVLICENFFEKIPMIREYIETDLDAAIDGDPAAKSKEEVILAYPGLMASTVNRLAHEMYLQGVPLVPRLMTEYAHSETGIDIHPGASLGKYFFIDHGTGIVVGESTTIGDHVKIYQGVTLGALSTRGGQSLRNTKRHPTIEDNVTIYSGASILGGETVIGHDCVIGGNVFITKSVPAGTRVSVKSQELIYKNAEGNVVKAEEFENDNNWFYVI